MSDQNPGGLHESDEGSDLKKLALIVEQSPSAVLITDSTGIIEFANKKHSTLSGYSFEEIRGKNVSILNSRHNGREIYRDLWSALIEGSDWNGEFRNQRKDGELYWVLASITPYYNSNGEITHFISIQEDISYLKKIEHELKQSEEKFRVLFETLPEGIVVTDMEGYILQINQAYLKIHRYEDRSELIGKNIRDTVSRDNYRFIDKLFIQAGETGYSKVSDYRLPYDEPVYVDVQVSLMKGEAHENIGFVLLTGDITESKMAEKALKESEARNRALIEAVPDIMFRVNDEGIYLDKMLGSKINEVFPQEVAVSTVKYISDAIRTRMIQIFEYPVQTGGGSEHYEARFVAIEDDEVLVILRNVTERRNAMEAIEEARREAELANRAKSEFLANMSHEIRTPLNSITGFIELLMRSRMDESQRDYLGIIKKSASSLLGIINDILDFSKIESKHLEINNVEFNPYVEFESVVSLYNIKAREKGIVFLSFIDPELPSGIISDPLRIKQILGNLLSNAIKFTPDAGFVRIDISLVYKMEEKCLVYFMVSDTGIGIPLRKQTTIFEAFSQADSSITRRFGGTGLGLSISANLARLLESEIIIESETGVGSRFFFSLEPEISNTVSLKESFLCNEEVSIYLYSDGTAGEMVVNNIESYLAGFSCSFTTGNDLTAFTGAYDLTMAVFSEGLYEYLMNNPSLSFENPPVLIISSSDEVIISGILKYFKGVLVHPLAPDDIVEMIFEKTGDTAGREKTAVVSGSWSFAKFSGHVLVGEDDKTNQKLIRLLLADYGINSDIAGNGLDVFDKFKNNKYDLVLMDMHMPVADGIETTQMIIEYEKENYLDHTPVVALTAKAIQGDEDIILSSGMDGYLTKPIEIDKLEAVFVKHLITEDYPDSSTESASSVQPYSRPAGYDVKGIAAELKIPEAVLLNIAGEFLNDAVIEIAELKKMLEGLSFGDLYLCAHKLKGASFNLRFEKLGSLIGEIEENSANNNKEFDYYYIIDKIEEELENIRLYFFPGA